MGRFRILSKDQVKEIKALLWMGTKGAEISLRYQVSAASISHIKRGTQYAEVPWPNGNFGAMPFERDRELFYQAKSKQAPNRATLPEVEAALSGVITPDDQRTDEELRAAVGAVPEGGSRPNRRGIKPPVSYAALTDDQLDSTAFDLPIYKKTEKDALGRLALKIVLAEIPPSAWKSDKVERLVESVRKSLAAAEGKQ